VRLTFLGTGTSFGVPQIGCRCPTCTSTDPRDRRARTAALIETNGKRFLIDTPPELRLQLVAATVDHVDAVLFTHAHADHVHGIDDLRALSVRQGAMLPAYGSRATMAELTAKFPYIFDPAIVVPVGTSKPELAAHVLEPGRTASIAGVAVLPVSLPHGDHEVFGYRIGPVAYLTDVKVIPESVIDAQDLDVLVLNALLSRPHPLHLSVPEAVAAAQRVGARRTFFITHLTHENTHAALAAKLPAGIAPAYDGLVIDLPGA